ncbi:hypothetical protein IKQ19_02460 [Candidatus Saccharibacteria bacterium]|nr:hypothetical protein [Candidatus Saccharibacteria bacterium]
MSQDPNLWFVRGTIHNADGSVFHNQGRILAYNKFPQRGWQKFAESDINSSTGAFELEFHTDEFQEIGFPHVDYPTLQIRVTDYEYNPLWMSCIYTTPPHELYMGDIVVNGDINENWTVCGNVYYSSKVPFTNGYVKIFDVRNGAPRDLGFCQLNAVGFYSVSYTKAQFQQGDTSITSPNLLVRVYSADGVNVANQAGPAIASAREFINIKVESGETVVTDGDCRIYGSVVNKLGRPVSGVKITAYCLHYDVTDNNGHPTGTFVHKVLDDFQLTDENGEYSISYNPDILPQGLLLDAEDAFGKDKVSLYAKLEVYETGAPTPKATIFKPLVFNGKREQRIDFELDVSSNANKKTRFKELDDLLAIYRETIVQGSTYGYEKKNKINAFLQNVDEFPLVVGRENLTDKDVRAYFLAYSLYYALLEKLGKTESDENASNYIQGVFALTYQGLVSNLDGLVNIEAPAVQKAVYDGVAQNQISASVTAGLVLTLWKSAVKETSVVNEMEDQFSPYHIFYLFLKNDLPQADVYVDGVLKTARVNLATLTGNDKQKIDSLMGAFYNAGSNYREMLSNLREDSSGICSSEELDRLELLIDLCDFGEWYGDFVVAAYKYARLHSESIYGLRDFLLLDKGQWALIVDEISQRYNKYNPHDPLALPHEFAGTTGAEQKALYVTKLMDLIVSWFPQQNLYNVLKVELADFEAEYSEPEENTVITEGPQEPENNENNGEESGAEQNDTWSDLLDILSPANLETKNGWEKFDLLTCDAKAYQIDHEVTENIDGELLQKLHVLQRVYRLTDNADAVAYLIKNGFISATSIAGYDEDYFVAEHSLGIGTKELATQIHRVAKSFVTEATFKIGQFHSSLNETDMTLPATSRGVSDNLRMKAVMALKKGGQKASNVAPPRIPASVCPTWKNLFGNINRNGATEGQSVLSASAYFVDLLNFFKANEEPYNKFRERRSDLLNLELTKANAEVAMPTIDLVNELLECLAGAEDNKRAKIIANQTPANATIESLRAEPLEWGAESEGENRQKRANLKMMGHAYPAILPLNIYREKATKILSNIPLSLYGLAESLGNAGNGKTCLFVDEPLHEILFKENFEEPWTSWGLSENNNNVYFPDKSEYKVDDPKHPTSYLKNKTWITVLSHVAILLDRAGITFKELKEIIALPLFSKYNVDVRCPDALQYQLADINGYILIDTSTIVYYKDSKKIKSVSYPTSGFFMELAAFIRFRRLLGWSFAEMAMRYTELNLKTGGENLPEDLAFAYTADPLSNWDHIQEMVLRFGITPLNSLAWHGFLLTEDELATVFDAPVLFNRYCEDSEAIDKYDDEFIRKDIAKVVASSLSIKESETLLFLENCPNFSGSQHEKFLNGLNYVYRYGTFAQKHNLTADELYLLQDAGLGSLADDIRTFSMAIRKWQSTSLPMSVLEDLLRIPDDSVTKKAEAFMGISLNAENGEYVLGSLYTTILDSWNAVKVDEEKELNSYPVENDDEGEPQEPRRNENPQEGEGDEQDEEPVVDEFVDNVLAYKDACSKILQSLGFADVPYIDQLAQNELPEDGEASTALTTLENWLREILKEPENSQPEELQRNLRDVQEPENHVVDILDDDKLPIQRLYLFYDRLKSIWLEEQVYIVLSQEFGIAAEQKAQDAFKALLVKIPAAAIEQWVGFVENAIWRQPPMETTSNDIIAYYALYKANILYSYVSNYVINSEDTENGLALGFEWNDWGNLCSTQAIDKDENIYIIPVLTPHSVLESLVDAFAVSDACGNSEYSYAVIPPVDEDSSNTAIRTLRDLRQLLLIPQKVFERCYAYAFSDSNLITTEQNGESIQVFDWGKLCGWDDTDNWLKFFKVYQLYLKTFTAPDVLENLFIELTKGEITNDNSASTTSLIDAVKALNKNLFDNYDKSTWNKFIQSVSDEIRRERRDALTGLVCWESQNETSPYKYRRSFLNANDLYAYYMIDILMEPDMSMSRIVQANACLQLFVQRCQLGLEGQGADGSNLFSDSALAQWEWMKNYQVWVANRKVFLYPENWLDVSLRDDKSSFFTELEERLQEVGGDSDDMERIYAEYLEKMRETANLEIVGCCKEDGDPNGETVYTLHIIGRTRGEPHRYYYRKYFAKKDPPGMWSPWELIEADITGDVVFPQIMNGRLYLAWPQFVQGQRQLNSGVADTSKGVSSPQIEFYVEIKMAWTCFNGKKWTGVKTTKNALYDSSLNPLDFQLDQDEQIGDRYHFKTSLDDRGVNFQLYRTLLDIQEDDDLAGFFKSKADEFLEKFKNQHIFHYLLMSRHYLMMSKVAENQKRKTITVTGDTKVNQFVETRCYKGVETQRLSPIGQIVLYADGKDECRADGVESVVVTQEDGSKQMVDRKRLEELDKTEDERGVLVASFSPDGTYLKRNYWVSEGTQSLVYKNRDILYKDREFRILPVNMDFYNPDDIEGHISNLPFFYMDSTNTFFVYPKSDRKNNVTYEFVLMSHPLVDEFFNQYRNGGKKELHSRGIQALERVDSYYTMYSGYNYYFGSAIGYHIAGDWAAWDMGQTFFENQYEPSAWVSSPYPAPYVDFHWNTPNGIYNWELFFYVPVRIADKLISEEKYEAALEWLQLVFDPQAKKEGPERIARWAKDLPSGAQYWRFLPFFANPDADKTILETLSVLTKSSDTKKKQELQCLIDQWKFDPFEPHLIAKMRYVAYQKFVIMKYLNVLIARGDELFTQDTTESVNLAIQFYIMAADILGPKSAEAPDPSVEEVWTAAKMLCVAKDEDKNKNHDWANSLIEYEDSMLIGRVRDRSTQQSMISPRTSMISDISKQTFYFNVPRNENLMAFWDTVADRLYKIRNSLNIEGVKRTLALFAPPIDPGMLVKARAAGLSISDILADAGAALPHYRFKVIVAKALEIARDLRNMQETLLQALKDNDSEALAQLRMQHRITAKKLSQNIFEIQMKELETEAASLEIEKEKKTKKQEHHKSRLEKIATDFENGYAKTMQKVADLREKTEAAKRIASAMFSIPDMDAGGIVNAFGGIDFHVASYGGRKLGEAALTMAESYLSKALEREAAALQQKAKGEEKKATEEETFEESIATNEIDQTQKQILINTIRQQRNEKEQELFEKELERDEEEYEFLCDKFTNKDLHEWLVKQMTKLSKTMCMLTTKVAKMAEKCYHFEIGDTDMGDAKSFISNSYWDGAYSGLLSADRLIADLHAMDVAYLENDKNEHLITCPISLKTLMIAEQKLDSTANEAKIFETLKSCTFAISSNEICSGLDLEFCRIRDVRLQVLTQEYDRVSLNVKLSLESNFLVAGKNIVENRIGVKKMATSMANSDCGKFDFSFKDDKYSIFEGAGLDSSWRLSISDNLGLEKISDVILYVSFTARNS